MTRPQYRALRYLCEGWQCQIVGTQPVRFGAFVDYGFHRGEQCESVAGNTLASLQQRGWIAWEPTMLTLVYDGSMVPGHRLVCTDTGEAAMQSTTHHHT